MGSYLTQSQGDTDGDGEDFLGPGPAALFPCLDGEEDNGAGANKDDEEEANCGCDTNDDDEAGGGGGGLFVPVGGGGGGCLLKSLLDADDFNTCPILPTPLLADDDDELLVLSCTIVLEDALGRGLPLLFCIGDKNSPPDNVSPPKTAIPAPAKDVGSAPPAPVPAFAAVPDKNKDDEGDDDNDDDEDEPIPSPPPGIPTTVSLLNPVPVPPHRLLTDFTLPPPSLSLSPPAPTIPTPFPPTTPPTPPSTTLSSTITITGAAPPPTIPTDEVAGAAAASNSNLFLKLFTAGILLFDSISGVFIISISSPLPPFIWAHQF
ncbi:hypothetical protein AMATHDRAFT_50511 [Amanita thiersii Skay4041]|uniref:Uncharacterized protein n=1 Tax=Amanita thiersii Skay4041 TaxID=703135 RepID=A0A2A9NHM8_9AGAR|nr:hypothetical protein AMATHDRAFT_50511 [Amanita thiersii Skay4041]